MKRDAFVYSVFRSPVGPIGLIAFCGQLTHLIFQKTEKTVFTTVLAGITAKHGTPPVRDEHRFKKWHRLLNRYFGGEKVVWNEPILFTTGTVLQKKIWRALSQIPYGTVQSYQEVAHYIGMKKGARVVGGACARNPIPIVIPCHRVVRHDGSLGGFRCGVQTKKRLLSIEGIRWESRTERNWIPA
jgi:methylated-DNA-[protein]-cysteine S-methyltransferase